MPLPRRALLALAASSLAASGLAARPALAARPDLPFLRPGETVLFQGDSITDGGRWRDSNDLNHTMGQSYAFILAAELGARVPERGATFLNRGVSGDRVTDLAARWAKDALALKPTLLSILVGVNDALREPAEDAATYERVYDRLLTETRAALPGVRIVLGEPFLLPVGAQKPVFEAHFAEVKARQAAVARLAARYGLPLVRHQAAFEAATLKAPADYWCWDGVHPTYAGHALMAQTWLATVEAAWPNG